MIPNFALSLSFEGITLLRRMGPRWARIDDVPLDHEDFDSQVIALRDRAEGLDPSGAQVALVIPNEQIRYLDQMDLGGDDTAREVAIRAALDGATPYAVNELRHDHVVSGGRLQIAAVAVETLDEAQSFAVEHGFDPVCFLAQAPEGAFDGAVLFGKAKGWNKPVARPGRAIRIVDADEAALTPLPKPELVAAAPKEQAQKTKPVPKPQVPPKPAAADAKAQPAPKTEKAATETKPEAPAKEPAEAQAPKDELPEPVMDKPAPETAAARPAAEKGSLPPAPAPKPAASPKPEAPAPVATKAAPQVQPEAPAAPEPAVPAPPKAPAGPAHSPAARAKAPSVAPEAPAIPPRTPTVQGAPKAPTVPPRAPAATAPAPEGPKPRAPKPQAPVAEAPVAKLAPAAPAPRAAARPAADVPAPTPAPAAPNPAEGADLEKPVAFSTIRAQRGAALPDAGAAPRPAVTGDLKPRFTPVAPQSAPQIAPEPRSEVQAQPKPKAGFFSTPGASDLLAQAAAAADAAEAGRPARDTAPKADKPEAAAPKRPGLSSKLKGKAKSKPGAKPPAKPGGKQGAKPGIKPIPNVAAARAAGLAAAPAREPKEDEFMAAPVAARNSAAQPGSGPVRGPVSGSNSGLNAGPNAGLHAGMKQGSGAPRPNPLARLAALRGPQGGASMGGAALAGAGNGGGAAAIPTGMRFDHPSEKDRLTVFGARDRDTTGGKPRFLGLMLTALLLLFLAGVAAWAAVFLDDGLARLFRSGDEPASAIAALPDGADAPAPAPAAGGDAVVLESAVPAASSAPAISSRPVARPEGEVQIAAFDPPAEAPADVVAPLNVPVDPKQLTPEEAAVSYAASGIWQRAPAKPHRPPEDGVDDVYAASIDPDVQIFDAVALPQAQDLQRGPDFQDPGLPPPAGLTFDFDERDLIRATPEGALTPDGLRIFTGRPPVIPPLRGESTVGPGPELDTPGAIRTRLNAMPRIRPQTRPDDLIEQRERSQLRGITRSELADIRPVMRPVTAKEQAEIDAPEATDQAVRQSLVPVGRPRNMAAIVDNADRSLIAVPVQTASVAPVAPRTVAPKVPSSASVAKAATSTNAINLKKINLIGVYGTAENRRALVRLANGKYQKVKVGDRLDGGRVTAIGDEELRYSKGSRNLTLKMPQT